MIISDDDDSENENNEGNQASAASKKNKKKEKKKAKEKEKKEKEGKKETAAELRARLMREELARIAAEKERLEREEDERIQKAEEARLAHERAEAEAEEKKRLKKEREKQKKADMKAKGLLLTEKQKRDKQRMEEMIRLREQQLGGAVVAADEKDKPKPKEKPKAKPKKKELETQESQDKTEDSKKDVESDDSTKDAWDATSSEEEDNTPEETAEAKPATAAPAVSKMTEELEDAMVASDTDSGLSEPDDKALPPQKRIQTRKQRADKKRLSTEPDKTLYRAAITCVLGHVDTGKTSLLDKLRRSNVQSGEAGGITQQIGGTNVPMENLTEMSGEQLKEQIRLGFSGVVASGIKSVEEAKLGQLPGVMFIDTPGHESFTNLRMRGSSLCDVAILVVDLMHGLEPQTIESLKILRKKGVPFIIAMNKVDRLYGWKSTSPRTDIMKSINAQNLSVQQEFKDRADHVIVELASEASLNARLYTDLTDVQLNEDYVPCVPTSAVAGDGLGTLIAQLVRLCRVLPSLADRLRFNDETQCSILEVKSVPGLGPVMDVLLVNGRLRVGSTVLVPTVEGPIEATIRELLTPQPMRELRVKSSKYTRHHRVKGATALRVVLRGDAAEKAMAGLPIQVLRHSDEAEEAKKDIQATLEAALKELNHKKSDTGVHVQASTLGALEALLAYLRTEKVPYTEVAVGPVHRRDVMKCSAMVERDPQYAVILAFDVKIETDARQLADSLGVKIFEADIIYHLTDKFSQYREEHKKRKQAELKSVAVFPCKLKILPQFIFNSRDPIVMGVKVESGRLVEGTPISTATKDKPFVDLGRVTSIELNHKQIPSARNPQEVCIKIEPGNAEGGPKMYGRHFDENDVLASRVTREGIDAVKEWFRDDMQRADWELMIELKKLYGVL